MLVDIFAVLQQMGVPTSEIVSQMVNRTRIPSDDPNQEWLAVASALGRVTVPPEELVGIFDALDPVLNHADASVSAAGAHALGRLGASDRVVQFCQEYLPDSNPLQDRLACIKALRAVGEAQVVSCSAQSDQTYLQQRKLLFDCLLDITADENIAMRMSAEAALVAVSSDDDACKDAIVKLEQKACEEATDSERLCQAAETISQMNCVCDAKLLEAKLAEILTSDAPWEVWCSAAGNLVKRGAASVDIVQSLVAKFQSGSHAQQVEALQLLAKTNPSSEVAASVTPVFFEAFCKATQTKTRPEAIAPHLAAVLGILKAEGSEVVAKYASVLRGADGNCSHTTETGDLRGAVLRSMSEMDTPPVCLKTDVYATLFNAEGEG